MLFTGHSRTIQALAIPRYLSLFFTTAYPGSWDAHENMTAKSPLGAANWLCLGPDNVGTFPRKWRLQVNQSASEERSLLKSFWQKQKAPGSEQRDSGGCLLYLERAGGGHGVGIQVRAVLVALLSWKYLKLGNRPIEALRSKFTVGRPLWQCWSAAGVSHLSTTLRFKFSSWEYPLRKLMHFHFLFCWLFLSLI